MIIDIQTQEIAQATTDGLESFVAVQDLDLMYVGGGTGTGMLF